MAIYYKNGLGEFDPSAQPGTPTNPLHKILTVPNFVTLSRLLLTITFVILYPTEQFHTLAIALFVIAACTDWVDGQLARKLNQVSWFGKRFDPVMDRLLIFSGVIALFMTERLPLFVFAYLAVRDIYLFIGSAMLMKHYGRFPDVCLVGKACTFVLMAGFAILLLDLWMVPGLSITSSSAIPGFGPQSTSFGIWLVYIGCILSIAAATIYTVRGIEIIRSNNE